MENESHEHIQEKRGFKNSVHYQMQKKRQMQFRADISLDEDDHACFHHIKVLIKRYEGSKRYCLDPRRIHEKEITHQVSCMYDDQSVLCVYNLLDPLIFSK